MAETQPVEEQPLRAELFSSEQMEQHARSLALAHRLGKSRAPDRLLPRLKENEQVLVETRNLLAAVIRTDRQIAPAGEWLLDNFHLIEEQIRTAKRHLPKNYSRELPRLKDGPSAGLPRVYDLALETISHGDGRVDPDILTGLVASYQSVAALKLGELWAIPIMLRLALIENLRRVAARLTRERKDRNEAARWAEQMTEIAREDPKSLILTIADMARSNPPMSSSFVAEFARHLSGQGSALALPLTWMEQSLTGTGWTVEALIQSENQQQASEQVTFSNSINSLRSLGATDWREFVETLSAVERVLREDPANAYDQMDFSTRDRYRHVVERLSKRGALSELEVAEGAIRLARQACEQQGAASREAHVGFYLVDQGLSRLEGRQRLGPRQHLWIYLSTILGLTLFYAQSLWFVPDSDGLSIALMLVLGTVSLVASSQLAVALVNWLTSDLTKPLAVPRMDFSEGIPADCKTLVVIPTLLSSAENTEALVETLEIRYLANRDQNLHFALLTDFRDSKVETTPEDEPLLRLAQERIEELNRKYGGSRSDGFFLFHRPRRWNPVEGVWMGHERKRGKLAELNSFLRGDGQERFLLVVGETAALTSVTYVITLDTDTQLPPDAAAQLVGAMAHPLNRPVHDENRRIVRAGYGILQPQVSVSLPGANLSRFAQLFGGDPGVDPYTRLVSDVHQDLFLEGSFIGKGIYEVEAFERTLKDRFPENTVLSHDLLEGCHVRAGLLSDVQLYEDYPASYSADVSRRHRWIRGDWQLLRWLSPWLRGPDGVFRRNPLSLLSRWKLFDNLRRSLVPTSMIALFLIGWAFVPGPLNHTILALGVYFLPPLAALGLDLLRRPEEAPLWLHFATAFRVAGGQFGQALFTLACLPYEASFSVDAIVRSVWRMFVSHRLLLEWNPSSEAGLGVRTDLAGFLLKMSAAPVLAASAAALMARYEPEALLVAAPILALWFVAPFVAWGLSRPLSRRTADLSESQTLFLRKLSRKTWRFFETFVGPEDHWLPPDNFQEQPLAVVAHRTSPTNVGMALISNLAAYDFGYLPAGPFIDGVSRTFATMKLLERHRGHFCNWYDTETLKPLPPVYISTVDSGNLSALLLTLRMGLLELPDQKFLGPRWLEGLQDTLSVLQDHVSEVQLPQVERFQTALAESLNSPPATIAELRTCLEGLSERAANVVGVAPPAAESEASWWAQALLKACRASLDEVELLVPRPTDLEQIPTLRELAGLGLEAGGPARQRIAELESLAQQSSELARTELDFLFDKGKGLLAIGYNMSEHRRDPGSYDLLASEARLGSFVAIALGDLPQESWFRLGRLVAKVGRKPVLLSWSGSMFEYLMPLLVMPNFENTLLDQTYILAVAKQREYGSQRGVPWGISESGYNAMDANHNYQYRAFGVPGLGLKRGLAEDLVVAPYASMMALMVDAEEACSNLRRLADEGLEGKYGFYEALDYTTSRLPRGQRGVVVRSFMAHHQGMSFLSLAHVLLGSPMQRRFSADPRFQASMLLLHERIPRTMTYHSPAGSPSDWHAAQGSPEVPVRVIRTPHTPAPELQLLSNGRYHVMITNAGGGYSRWKDFSITRWREDTIRDNWGTFCYLRDLKSGKVWSTAHQPTLQPVESYEAIFSESRAEFRCRNHQIETHLEIAVSPEDDIELRRLQITNPSRTRRTIELTSYAEVVLAPPATDSLHPAFSNLFVQTEIVPQRQALLCHRRPRSSSESTPWMFHLMTVHEAEVSHVSFETDRLRFIGHGNTPADPDATRSAGPLSGSQGSVLDPIVAIRCQLTVGPEQSVTIHMVWGVAEDREACLDLVEKYHDRRLADRVFDLAWTHSQVVLRQLNATEADAQLYERLAGSILYSSAALRADPSILVKNHRGQPGLWGYSVSGDLPIVLLQIGDANNLGLVRQFVQAQAYWRLKGLTTDILIWNEGRSGYRQSLHDQIVGMIATGFEAAVTDRLGGIFMRTAEQISSEDRVLLQTAARAIISDTLGTLHEQVGRRKPGETKISRILPTRSRRPASPRDLEWPRLELIFDNGHGGFTPDGREYVITTSATSRTPAPWVNVLANPRFGSVVSECGSGYTWSENAHELRLTPWHNDPVGDPSGEALYLRDEETGHTWSPTPLPCGGAGPFVSRHGFGYSVFEHREDGLRSELWVYVAKDAPIKFWVLKLRNESGRSRRLSATGYMEWVLGDLRPKSVPHLITEIDSETGAMLATNPYNTEFPGRVAFFDVDQANRSFTGDRSEFLGRNGSPNRPDALARVRLSGKVGAALDSCAAIQIPFELADGQEREVHFRLGAGRNLGEARELVQRFRGAAAARTALEEIWQHWKVLLGAVLVETPDPAINVLANGWLLYQTLSSRLWGRSGFYQSGGAFGFRDQLQDVMALLHAAPHLMREQLLLCAAHQFPEGDVQHWWHPPLNRGVRTHCSDDYLWLPLAACRYVLATGDTGVLDELVPFVEGRPVSDGEDSYYDLPTVSSGSVSLYEHCVRAILRGLRFGGHGLPLIGSGDWNDGMNLVGIGGKGESVWLGFFLYDVLERFAVLAQGRGDVVFAERCQKEAAGLRESLEQQAWDGEWYRRAYFDDGTPLGSAESPECRIDSISQSWAVLSGAGAPERARLAMASLDRHLVRRSGRLIQLLDPPFDRSALDPGYIKGYVPGVRENGGQYTHAAIWAVMAFAQLGDSSRAWELMDLINPVSHAATSKDSAVYKVEPYVVAADVYGVAPHVGRGGWTWYTGSAGWMYRLILESLLGLKLDVDRLSVTPCPRPDWTTFKVHYRYRRTTYHITVIAADDGQSGTVVTVDGVVQAAAWILLVDDQREHAVEVKFSRQPESRT